jgi:hypothetical protein
MRPDLATRIAFYLAEAAVLTVPVACGLLLARGAARRARFPYPKISWIRISAIWLWLGALGTVLGELAGPEMIIQYYVAAAVLTVGAGAWLLGRFFPRADTLAARPKAP